MDGRLNIAGSYEYNKTHALAFTDRDVTGRQLTCAANPQNTSGTDNIPGSIIILNRRIPEVTVGGLPFRTAGSALSGLLTIPDPSNPGQRVAAQFGPGGVLQPYSAGTFYSASVASGGQGLNLAELSSLQSPVDRHLATGFGRFDITDSIRATVELFYSKFDTVEPFNQPIYNSALFGGLSVPLRVSTERARGYREPPVFGPAAFVWASVLGQPAQHLGPVLVGQEMASVGDDADLRGGPISKPCDHLVDGDHRVVFPVPHGDRRGETRQV